jgi:C-terminal processing protease CtpA/Prc
MYLRRVDSSISEGMKTALGKYPDVPGWVVDIRGNSGGGYGDELTNQVKAIQKPVVVISDAGCISAGETLIRDFIRYADAHVIGKKSAGSSSSKREWKLPSGIASIRISTRSRYGPDNEPIEFNGISPHEIVEAVPEEVQNGQNSEIQRAVEHLDEKNKISLGAA